MGEALSVAWVFGYRSRHESIRIEAVARLQAHVRAHTRNKLFRLACAGSCTPDARGWANTKAVQGQASKTYPRGGRCPCARVSAW